MDDYDDDYTTSRSTSVAAEHDDDTPPERNSPSFSFHEERRLLKSDEYWLVHKIPRLPPPALSTSPSASVAALDGLSLSRYDEVDDEGPSKASPTDAAPHCGRMDEDECLELEEEKREKMGGMAAGGLPSTQFDTVRAFAESGVGSELEALYAAFSKCLALRDKYMTLSCQMLGDNPRDRDGTFGGFRDGTGDVYGLKPDQRPATCELSADPNAPQWQMNPPPPAPHWKWEGERPEHPDGESHKPSTTTPEFELANCEVPGPEDAISSHTFRLNDEGVYTVYTSNGYDKGGEIQLSHVPRLKEYYMDLEYLLNVCSDGPAKSFAFRRLKYLQSKWSLYGLLNEYQELADMKAVPHRDFYNVRKVDTHIHHSASMNQKHLLRFIKRKLRRCPDEIVIHRDGKDLTLSEVFKSLNLTAYDLSIDTLDMHAHQEFHRFDRFNNRYNPTGSSRLREIFLKTDNLLKGTYLAELTTELIADLEQSKYQNSEWRVSIYGRKADEWDKLAKWVVDNKLVSHNVRWLIQVPRLYEVFKAGGLVNNFEDVVKNVFKPLFEVTQDPSSHPELHIFLQRVVGFDSVDDESKPERRLYKKFPTAQAWDTKQSPPYSYWIYYMYANMASLNVWRRERGFNTFVLRPHCGEAGDPDHLSSAFLTSHSISHGILLRKVPALQYLFYLKQIGLAMSPLSNNALFLTYERNPFKDFFKIGMNVSLSTDDPLQFHFTAQHLLEEYSCAAQIYKLTPADMCELARNSVVQSGWEMQVKKHWIGHKWYLPGAAGNDIHKTNVPNIRLAYRHATLVEELNLIQHGTHTPSATPGPMRPSVSGQGGQGEAGAARARASSPVVAHRPISHGSADPDNLGAAAMAQTRNLLDPAFSVAPGAAELDVRHRRRSMSLANKPTLGMSATDENPSPYVSPFHSPVREKAEPFTHAPRSPVRGKGLLLAKAPSSPTRN
ncbi:hypothetical protein CspHIS471_0600610 [Cutaneotrichosporon sp. HIS471]|nr:hypothetical protein CspHIS471_0600610 [Cutaneotrichosporon sp. HIS471]